MKRMKKVIVSIKKVKWYWATVMLLVVFMSLHYMGVLFPPAGKETVRVYVLNGVITDSSSLGSEINPRTVREKLDKSGQIGALVLRVNSPGGSVVGSQEILAEIRNFKDGYNIPVVISMGEMAASGGYYIALAGDKIVADAGTLTGSIGVISQFLYTERLYEMLGLEEEIVKSGKYKDMGHSPLTDEEKAIMQTLSDNVYMQFVNEVARSRGLSVEDVKELATGEVFSGEQAKSLGLIDEIGTLDDAIALAIQLGHIQNPRVEIRYPSSNVMDSLLGAVSYIDDLVNGAKFGLSVRW